MAHTPCKGKTAQPRAVALGNRHICVNPLALKEQKKHTLCVSAAPVGRTPENTRHTRRCPGLKSRLGLQPASAQTPPQQLDRPRPHMLNGRRHTKNKPAKVKKRGHIPALMRRPHMLNGGMRHAKNTSCEGKKKGQVPAMGRVDGSWNSETLYRGEGNSMWEARPPSKILNDLMT